MMQIPRPEYPRPQFVRHTWLNLNGPWEFTFDDANAGEAEGWWRGDRPLDQTITVPFAYQTPLSGIGDPSFHDIVWYRRTVEIPAEWAAGDLLLHFGAVDYRAKVWVNGHLVATHEGGHTPFTASIAHVAHAGANVLVVRAEDPSTDLSINRGKQYWYEQSASIFYTRTSGIWQTVWLEPVARHRIERVKFTPDLGSHSIGLEIIVHRPAQNLKAEVAVRYEGELVADESFLVTDRRTERAIGLGQDDHFFQRTWTPDHPNLYDITFTLVDAAGTELDRVDSYFGMRSVSIENGRVLLNKLSMFQKLILDQGYWPESLLTPPSDEAIRKDIELTKAMGFNGVRKHQKVEDPRYLYWADKLGLLVWGEMAAAYRFNDEAMARTMQEWREVVERDYNHPCITTWVPVNESWGTASLLNREQERQFLLTLYHMLKALDGTRPISSNDGWEQPTTDLFTIHDYNAKGAVLKERYGGTYADALPHRPAGRFFFLPGYGYEGQPMMLTEFGGIAYKLGGAQGWGYSAASDGDDFVARYRDLIEALAQCPNLAGWCYTQLTDVEQEINGLLTYDRQPKVPVETIRAINGIR